MKTDKYGFGGADRTGFAVNEKEHIIYILEFKRTSDTGPDYSETQKLGEAQHLAVTQGLKNLFRDTQ